MTNNDSVIAYNGIAEVTAIRNWSCTQCHICAIMSDILLKAIYFIPVHKEAELILIMSITLWGFLLINPPDDVDTIFEEFISYWFSLDGLVLYLPLHTCRTCFAFALENFLHREKLVGSAGECWTSEINSSWDSVPELPLKNMTGHKSDEDG